MSPKNIQINTKKNSFLDKSRYLYFYVSNSKSRNSNGMHNNKKGQTAKKTLFIIRKIANFYTHTKERHNKYYFVQNTRTVSFYGCSSLKKRCCCCCCCGYTFFISLSLRNRTKRYLKKTFQRKNILIKIY